MNTIQRISNVISRLSDVGGYVTGILIVITILLVLAEVFTRAVLSSSLQIVDQTAGWLLVAITFLGLAWTLKDGGHVRITIISGRLSERKQCYLVVCLVLLAMPFLLLFAVFVWERLLFVFQSDIRGMSVYRLPVYPVWIALFAGGCLFTLQLIGVLLDNVISLNVMSKCEKEDILEKKAVE